MTWEQALKRGRPSRHELATLPRRSIVAYAVRCALRVQPLFRPTDDGAAAAVGRAIELAADYARGKSVSRDELLTAAASAAGSSAADAAARLDFEELVRRGGRAGNVGRAVNPYDGESLGNLWHGHAPDWYLKAKAELDERLGLSSGNAGSSTALKAVTQQRDEAQQRIDKLEKELTTTR